MGPLRRLRATAPAGDAGFAMVTVLGIGFILTALMLGSLVYASQVTPQARRDQDWNAALAAAQAGADDYVAKLNRSDSYALTFDCANVAMQGPDAPPNHCTWNTGPSTPVAWQPVQAGVPAAGGFHYVPRYQAGSVQLTVTGKVGKSYRTLDVRVARGGSKDYLYYTDFEDADPSNKEAYQGTVSAACGGNGKDAAKYWYQPLSGSTPPSPTATSGRRGCTEIQFAAGDVLDGPVHFNDTPLIGTDSGTVRAVFRQGFETADPNCTAAQSTIKGYCYRISSTGTPDVGAAGARPASNWQLPDNSAQFATFPGCNYYGDTRIRFTDDGYMSVWNTKSASNAGSIVSASAPAGTNCGDKTRMAPAVPGSDLRPGAANPQIVPVPTDGVIYVRNAGTSAPCAAGQVVNGTASGSVAGDVIPQGSSGAGPTTEQDVSDANFWQPWTQVVRSTQTWTRSGGAYTPSPSTAPSQTVKTSNSSHYATFNCGQGNVYVEGTLRGRVTVAAENNVIVTGNLLLAGTSAGGTPGSNHMLGLVAGNSVVVYHPLNRNPTPAGTSTTTSSTNGATCSSTVGAQPTNLANGGTTTCTWVQTTGLTYPAGSLTNAGTTSASDVRSIYASIQTLQHSFWVQGYASGGPLGKLSVRGSVAQRWRGIVGTPGSPMTGYLKEYVYDTRLKYQSPPYFPQWTNSTWSAATSGELKPKYLGQ